MMLISKINVFRIATMASLFLFYRIVMVILNVLGNSYIHIGVESLHGKDLVYMDSKFYTSINLPHPSPIIKYFTNQVYKITKQKLNNY